MKSKIAVTRFVYLTLKCGAFFREISPHLSPFAYEFCTMHRFE